MRNIQNKAPKGEIVRVYPKVRYMGYIVLKWGTKWGTKHDAKCRV